MRRLIHKSTSAGKSRAPVPRGERGFILIAAVALLATLLGAVLLCLYPLAWEANQAPRHREAMRRMKLAEQGIFWRLADQPGGVNTTCGGYFSDLGPKMIVAEVANASLLGGDEAQWFLLAFWRFRLDGNLPNFKFDGSSYIFDLPGLNYGLNDTYRYDLRNGFWVGYRGKRYIVPPIGEENLRRDYDALGFNVPAEPWLKDGYKNYVALGGTFKQSEVYLRTRNTRDDQYIGEYPRMLEHRRYYNPVEKLVVILHDRRAVPTPLTARLIYAKQPDPAVVTSDNGSIVPHLPSIVYCNPSDNLPGELPRQTLRNGADTTFVFLWEPSISHMNDPDVSGIDRAHTFEIGLKKLVLLENGVPVFATGIVIPPVRDCQCKLTTVKIGSHPIDCKQPYYDQYVVEVDYDG